MGKVAGRRVGGGLRRGVKDVRTRGRRRALEEHPQVLTSWWSIAVGWRRWSGGGVVVLGPNDTPLAARSRTGVSASPPKGRQDSPKARALEVH